MSLTQPKHRKVLPSKPSTTEEAKLSTAVRKLDLGHEEQETHAFALNFLTPYLREYALQAELLLLHQQDLPGVHIVPADKDPLVWFGVLFVHQGLYQGAIFRFRILFPEQFPDGGCPRIVFESRVFHPAIDLETGELNVQEEFGEWKKKVHHTWQVVQFMRRVFFQLDAKIAVNKRAARLLTEDSAKFRQEVEKCVDTSREKIYTWVGDDDPNYIRFEPYSDQFHGPIRDSIKNMKNLSNN